jgi:predicted RNA polymerase sigma factor
MLRRERRECHLDLDACSCGSRSGPDERLADSELRERLIHALAVLPEALRTVVILRDIDGLEYSEIVRRLEIPPGTVRSRLHRARATLRCELERASPRTPPQRRPPRRTVTTRREESGLGILHAPREPEKRGTWVASDQGLGI